MKKGKITLSVCTSLLCIGMLAGCNGGAKGATWSSVLVFLDGIYTNIAEWEAIDIECDSVYNYSNKRGTENYKARYTNKDGYLFGSATDYSIGYFDSPYRICDGYEYYAKNVRYEKGTYEYLTYEEYWYASHTSSLTYGEVNSAAKAYISNCIFGYGIEADKLFISGAKLGKRKAEWNYSDSFNSLEMTVEVNKDFVINYFSLNGDFVESDGTGNRNVNLVIKETNSSKVKTPSWVSDIWSDD